jgi:hypothetical protein
MRSLRFEVSESMRMMVADDGEISNTPLRKQAWTEPAIPNMTTISKVVG